MPETSWGFAHFLTQTDAVGACVLVILSVMSLLSWYLIFAKLWRYIVIRSRSQTFLASFHRVRHLVDGERLAREAESNPFVRLLDEGLAACRLLREAKREGRRTDEHGFEMTSSDDYISAALERSVANESRTLENGLTVLASIASSAPFIGLFGTVWGIFHALQAIAFSGQASLDKVAGPVGEALIMTACGLFVAIPAVLAYNAFTRLNRNLSGELESHAHEVFGLLGLGELSSSSPQIVELSPLASHSAAATPQISGVR
jgi:biopolymer transport protein ExbB